LSYFLYSAIFAFGAGAVIAGGLPYTLKQYRGQFSIQEKRATFALACTAILLVLAMFDIRHFLPGIAGDVATGVTMALILFVGIAYAGITLFRSPTP
jgi:archaellum biogenesis protein FlaJ (TadC family)